MIITTIIIMIIYFHSAECFRENLIISALWHTYKTSIT